MTRHARNSGDAGSTKDVGTALLAGAVAGLAGAAAMLLVRPAVERIALHKREEDPAEWERAVRATARAVHVKLPDAAAKGLGIAAHLAYGACWGIAFGAAERKLRWPTVAAGLACGAIVYGANFLPGAIMPSLRAEAPPTRRHPRRAIIPVATHATFGLATAAAFAARTNGQARRD